MACVVRPGHGRKDVSIFQRPRYASPCHTPGTRAKLASGALCHTAPAQSARSSWPAPRAMQGVLHGLVRVRPGLFLCFGQLADQ